MSENILNNDEKTSITLINLERKQRISSKIKIIGRYFNHLDKSKKTFIKPIIEKLAFMDIILADLQEEIVNNGATEEYQNGANQKGIKKSSTVEVYNTMIKNYAITMKLLLDLLPKDEVAIVQSKLTEFNAELQK